DMDSSEGEENLFKVISENIVTPTATTPRGGKHLYFKYDPRIPSVSSKVIKKVDTKSDGGMVVAAPSIRPEGRYTWIDGLQPIQVEYAAFPEEYIALLDKVTQKVSGTNEAMAEIVGMFEHGR